MWYQVLNLWDLTPISVDSIRIQLNGRTPTWWLQRIRELLGVGKTHTQLVSDVFGSEVLSVVGEHRRTVLFPFRLDSRRGSSLGLTISLS